MGLLYTQLLERLDKVVAERDAALADAQVEKTRADELNLEVERLSKTACKKIESLEKDLAKSISALHDARLENSENIQSLNQTARKFNVALNEVEQLKQALHDARLENSGQAARIEKLKHHIPDVTKMIRPEPSRLEIAAMLKAGWFANRDADFNARDYGWWIEQADMLIAAAKEGK